MVINSNQHARDIRSFFSQKRVATNEPNERNTRSRSEDVDDPEWVHNITNEEIVPLETLDSVDDDDGDNNCSVDNINNAFIDSNSDDET